MENKAFTPDGGEEEPDDGNPNSTPQEKGIKLDHLIAVEPNKKDGHVFKEAEVQEFVHENEIEDKKKGYSEANEEGNQIGRYISDFWTFVGEKRKEYSKGIRVFIYSVLNVAYIAYFIGALVVWRQGEDPDGNINWCNGIGFLIICTVLVYSCLLYFQIIKRFFGRWLHQNCLLPISKGVKRLWKFLTFKIAVCVIIVGGFIAFLVVDTKGERHRLISFLGIVVLILLGAIFSRHPGQIKWRPVILGLIMQLLFGLFTLRWEVGRQIFECLGDKVAGFLAFADKGSSFIYGVLVTDYQLFAFKTLSVIFFFSFMIQILYYYGAMQWIVTKIGWFLQSILGTTMCESVNTAASIFVGMTESPLLIQPYLPLLTKSEIHAIMTGGFATISGSVMAAYINFKVPPAHLLTASVMSAPAALCYAKLFYPETEESKTKKENISIGGGVAVNALDAASRGASEATQLVLGIISNVIAFVACVEFMNNTVQWLGTLVGADLTIQRIISWVFIPLTWLMGVSWDECDKVAWLVGVKTIINEFVAYDELGKYIKQNAISDRSKAIATYALCGFSNPGSIGIMIAALSAMSPSRRSDIAEVAFRAFISGCAACFLTACVAGMLINDK